MRTRQATLLALLIYARLGCEIEEEEWQPPGVLHFEYPQRILPEFAVVMAIFFWSQEKRALLNAPNY
jgi:hypothetical protein